MREITLGSVVSMAHATRRLKVRRHNLTSSRIGVLPFAVLIVALTFALLIVALRENADPGKAAGAQHTRGSTAAPVVLEEWSDFE